MSNESNLARVSSLVKSQLPAFYQEDGQNFIAFMEAYYEYMEQEGKMSHEVRNLTSYKDVSTTTDQFIKYFLNTFLPSVALDAIANKALMVKYIKQFNQARGTNASYRLLFRALYDEDIEFSYPADQMLKVSDGDWRIERYLVTTYDPATYKFIGKTIVGADSGAEALVEDIVRRKIRGRDIMQILLSNIKGFFSHEEPIRLKGDLTATPHAPTCEAGINGVTILSSGSYYEVGDVLNLISSDRGKFAKVVVTNTVDLGGTLVYTIEDGGSGFTASTGEDGTVVEFIGGDGNPEGSFVIRADDITDTFAIAINTNKIQSNTVFGAQAPTVPFADGGTRQMTTFANVHLAAVDYGFPAENEQVTAGKPYRDQTNAAIVIANTSDPSISVGASLFGVTSGANGTVNIIKRAYNSTDVVLDIDGFQHFQNGEKVNISTSTGTTVGTVSSFSANAAGSVVLQVGYNANTFSIGEGDEIVGMESGQFGIVTKVLADTTGSQDYDSDNDGTPDWSTYTLKVTANNTANLTSTFDTGPMGYWLEDEGIRKVGQSWVAANVVLGTSNANISSPAAIQNIYTKLVDVLNFEATTFGTIAQLSLQVGGAGYSLAPTIRVRENDIAALGIGEAYLTLQTDDANWLTGNSSFTRPDTNDGLLQSSTGARGDIKQGVDGNAPAVVQYANGTYETVVRVWQRAGQRSPGNIIWANNSPVTIRIFDSEYVPGEDDTRTVQDTGTATIVNVQDEGILGQNAQITAGVGANGTVTGLRVIDSGFAYKQKEVVLVEASGRNNGTSAQVQVNLNSVGNSEGYYASTRGHLDSKRSFIQDSEYYQEFSYEVVSPISLDRYRDVALKLVHPAGQALFGKYQLNSETATTTAATAVNTKKTKSAGTIALSNGSFTITGSGTSFATNFSNNGLMHIQLNDAGTSETVRLNIVSSDTVANTTTVWAGGDIASANVYYNSGSI